ncbi:hypothetical protein IQ265_23760 [Nodosilinea sp. LEGE 06152]|uniref:hypothetical protein n=1 Tax=Nodosilinea sp. LEGE 06152 TaxID=2777966 RepID=UPI001880C571|nr:hypothetical protein [Nodosilinea sp. LEGE 06152]MBE9159827.1 hypothetical protein [Nodosilinea sp. LEGE 06152]
MGNDSVSIVSASQPATLGDRLRGIAEELRQETDTQIKATSRILGAAAQMAQNHDRLIDEVVEMVEEDLERMESGEGQAPYDVASLQQEFKTLKAAKAHFGIKANGWDALVTKLSQASNIPASAKNRMPNATQEPVLERLSAIEREMVFLRGSMEQVIGLLQELVKPC